MGAIGNEMKQLDLTSEAKLVLEDGGRSETFLYTVVDNEIKLFDKHGSQLGKEIIWRIERLTADELNILLVAREDNKGLARLKYRAKG